MPQGWQLVYMMVRAAVSGSSSRAAQRASFSSGCAVMSLSRPTVLWASMRIVLCRPTSNEPYGASPVVIAVAAMSTARRRKVRSSAVIMTMSSYMWPPRQGLREHMVLPRVEWAVSWPVREIGGGDLEGQAWWGLGVHRADLGADDEKLPVHLGDGGGAVPVRVGQFGHDRRRAPAGCQPGHADHEAEVLDVVAAVGDAVEHVTVEQHPIGVELIAAKVDRGGAVIGRVGPPQGAALALGGDQQRAPVRVRHDAVEVGRIGGPEGGQVDGELGVADPVAAGRQRPHPRMPGIGHIGAVPGHDDV